MKPAVLFGLFLAVLAWGAEEHLEKADYYYYHHHKDRGYLYKAKDLCEEVLSENPSNARAQWRLARLWVAFADDKEEKNEKLYRYEKGKEYAQKAKENDPGCTDCHFWFGVSLGRIGQTKGVLNSLSLAGPVKQAFEKALEIDPNHAGALDGMAMWYKEVPGFAGGDVNKSIQYLKKGLSVDPSYTLLYVDLAKIYIDQKNYPAARELLKKCLTVSDPKNPADFYLDDKPEAEKLLKEIEGK